MGMRRVLITGASGFTGRHACERFAASGWEVVAVASGRSSGGTPPGAEPASGGGAASASAAAAGAGAAHPPPPGEAGAAFPPPAGGAGAAYPSPAAGAGTAHPPPAGGAGAAFPPPAAWAGTAHPPPPPGEAGAAFPPPAPAGSVHWRRCDLTDRQQVRRLCLETEPDALLHLAGQNAVDRSWQDPALTLAVNAMATVHLLEALREAGGERRALVIGSMLAHMAGGEAHPYAFSKKLQVSAALAWHRWFGLQVLVAEPSNLVGPGRSAGLCGKIARWTAEAERAEGRFSPAGVRPFRLSSLQERRDYLDVRDAVRAYETLLRAGEAGRCYALGSGRMRSIAEIKERFERLAAVRLAWEIGSGEPPPSPEPRDLSAIHALGWEARIPFERSLADALAEERAAVRGGRKEEAGA